MSGDWSWTDAASLCVLGRGWTDTALPFSRLPRSAHGVVREEVWNLGLHSTGVTVEFESDATDLRVRWRLGAEEIVANHTATLAFSGLDLYGRTEEGAWRWVGVTREVAGRDAESPLVNAPLDGKMRRYRLYLPLYSAVERLEVGTPPGACIRTVSPPQERPVAYYGTSIVHGAGVSRPGMCHVSILGRRLRWPVLNLGVSGNAVMEPEVADLLAELDPALYVLDPVPNMNAELVEERAEGFVRRLREARPATPIVLVEDRTYPAGWACPSQAHENLTRRVALKAAYGRLLTAGMGPLHYIEGDCLLGVDGEGTNDGSHTNDLGAARMAEALQPVLHRLLHGL